MNKEHIASILYCVNVHVVFCIREVPTQLQSVITCGNLLTPSVKVKYDPASASIKMIVFKSIVCFMSLRPRAATVVFATADTHTAPAALLL